MQSEVLCKNVQKLVHAKGKNIQDFLQVFQGSGIGKIEERVLTRIWKWRVDWSKFHF